MIKVIAIVIVCLLIALALFVILSGNSTLAGKFDKFAQDFLFPNQEKKE